MRLRFCCLLVLVMPLPGHTATDRHIAIAAAADLHYAIQVAPFELFFSADE